jgi:hypothetical protein
MFCPPGPAAGCFSPALGAGSAETALSKRPAEILSPEFLSSPAKVFRAGFGAFFISSGLFPEAF